MNLLWPGRHAAPAGDALAVGQLAHDPILPSRGDPGVDTNIDLLAAYAGALELGEEHGDIVLLSRPYTRLLVALDPEGSWRSGALGGPDMASAGVETTNSEGHNL